jgi:hypothetical protein
MPSTLKAEDLNAVVEGCQQDPAGRFGDGHIADVADLWFGPDGSALEVVA